VKDHAEKGAVDHDPGVELAVVLDEPSFLNLFMKKFTRDGVVPTISDSVSCEILATTCRGLTCLP
jgi:hypothetical protein